MTATCLIQRGTLWLAPLVLALLASGCATARVNWNARIGTYTFDQAVMELGPPDKQARLTDGTLVAEWLTRRGYAGGYYPAYYAWGPYAYGYPWPAYTYTASPDYFLRLTFDSSGKLEAWKQFVK